MDYVPWMCVIAACVVITLAIRKFDNDLDCMEYVTDPPEEENECIVRDITTTEQSNTFPTLFNSYSHEDDESQNIDYRWYDEVLFSPKSPTMESSKRCYCGNMYCQCSGRNLNQVPQDLPQDTRKLDLSNNVILNLPNGVFYNYSQLTYLDLSKNNLTQLQAGSFRGLLNLLVLNLTNNLVLYLDTVMPMGVFSDLKSLKCLKLNKNLPNNSRTILKYPDKVLAELVNLTTLYIDGINYLNFGEYFRNMTKLRTLVLGGYKENNCHTHTLSKHSFVNIEQVSNLDLSYCDIHGNASIRNPFEPLVNLTKLDVSCNFNFGVKYLMDALSYVREYNITRLKMNHIESLFSPSIVINAAMIESLPTSLRYLETQGNNFQSIDQGALQLLPPNLTYIEAGGNRFVYGDYFKELRFIKSLKILKLNGGLYLLDIPKTVASLFVADRCTQSNEKRKRNEPLIFHLPPNLLCLSLRVSGLRFDLTELIFDSNNSLESLILTNNYFPSLQGPIKGLPKLQKLFLSDSNVLVVDQQMFRHSRSLQELRLRNNKLTKFFLYHPDVPIFRYLENLKIIDLSYNLLTVLPERMFKNLTDLEEMDLSHNNIEQFNLTLQNMFYLQIINLSNTHLSSLPVSTRRNIDLLMLRNRSIRVDMSYCPIRCECNNIDFIKWMVSSKAFDANFNGYMCQYEDSSRALINDSYEETLLRLSARCANNTTIFLVVISATFGLVAFVTAAVLYRFRWKLRYMYYVAYLMLKDKKTSTDETPSFRYDVFISYAYQDEIFILEDLLPELNQRDLKVLVHGRDFTVGEFIASNIVTAVKESRKTLVVLTRHLLNSTWCQFEIQMANMESVHTGRPVLVFLIKESIPTTELTTDLLYHLKRNTYIEYPPGETTGVFWDKLARDIKLI